MDAFSFITGYFIGIIAGAGITFYEFRKSRKEKNSIISEKERGREKNGK